MLILALVVSAVSAPGLELGPRLGIDQSSGDVLALIAQIGVFWPVIAWLERRRPERAEWNMPHDDVRTDILHLVFSGTLMQLLFQLTLGAAAVAVGKAVASSTGGGLWPTAAPVAVQLLLALVVAELGHYAFHRLSHEHPLVWRLHAPHHSARRLYWLNATRFQWLDIFSLIALQSMPLLILGAGREALLAYALFASVYGQIQHMNVRVDSPWLDWIFSTPGLHRWHHSTDPREGNTNYGAILIVWDLVFRSFFRPSNRAFDADVGIGDMPNFPSGYIAQQLSPWQAVESPPSFRPGTPNAER